MKMDAWMLIHYFPILCPEVFQRAAGSNEHTLDRLPLEGLVQFRVYNQPIVYMHVFRLWEKPECLEKTNEDTRTCKEAFAARQRCNPPEHCQPDAWMY